MKNSRRQAVPVLATLHKLNLKYNKLYCYPSQLKIMALLSLYQDINIAIATLNRWLRDLEDKGYVIRVRRIKRDRRRGIMFKSTLYKITIEGYQALKGTGVSVWREIKAITAAGIKAGERALGKFKGPVALKTILGSTTMFGVKQKTFILEK
jgi:DNA-binding transcriptional ArsR family regulator